MWIFISIVLFIILVVSLRVCHSAASVCIELFEKNKRLEQRLDSLNSKLFGRSVFDPTSALGQLREGINKNSQDIKDANKFTQFVTNELEKYFGIKYEKKIITTNGVEKDVSKYVRRGRR